MEHYTAEHLLDPKNKALLAEIEAIVTSSFEDDPCSKFVLTSFSPEGYIPALEAWERFLLRCSLHVGGRVTVIRSDPSSPPTASLPAQSRVKIPAESRMQAVAVLLPPGEYENFGAITTTLRAGILPTLRILGLSTAIHLLRDLVRPMEAVEKRIFPTKEEKKSYWTLMLLGAHPSAQGQGLGTQLLHDVQQQVRSDNEKRGKAKPRMLYLEASNTGAHRLYQRVGFVDREEVVYGKLKEGEDFSFDEKGKVVGGKIFPMLWTS